MSRFRSRAELLAGAALAAAALACACSVARAGGPARDDGPRPVLDPDQIPDLPDNPLMPRLLRSATGGPPAVPDATPAAGSGPEFNSPAETVAAKDNPPPAAAEPEAEPAAAPSPAEPAPAAAQVAAAVDGLPLQLAVDLNGKDNKVLGEFVQLPDGSLAATPDELRAVGVRPPSGLAGARPVPLSQIAGLQYRYDAPGQRIFLQAPNELLMPYTGPASAGMPFIPGRSDWGFVVNYLGYGFSDASRLTTRPDYAAATLTLDARAFSPYGVVRQTGILGRTLGSPSEATRLDTNYTYTDPSIPLLARAGDIITPGPAWARPVRIGGVQAGKDYGLRPDIVTAALPVLSGTAAVPTTVDVFVNGIKTFSQDVPAGPWALSNIGGLYGTGAAEVVTRDVTGREVRTPVAYTSSTVMLRPGIVEYSGQAGYPRYGYGTEDFAYGASPVGSFALRAGVYEALTVQAYSEMGQGLRSLGGGASVNVLDRAVFTAAAQISHYGGRTGILPYVALETRIGPVTLAASSQRSYGGYEDLASILTRPVAAKAPFGLWNWDPGAIPLRSDPAEYRLSRNVDQVSASVAGPVTGSTLTAGYVHASRSGESPSHIVTAGYSQSIGSNMSFYGTAFHDFGGRGGTGAYFGLSWLMDDYSATAGGTYANDRFSNTVSAGKTLRNEQGSWGVRMQADRSEDRMAGRGDLGYVGRYARVRAGASVYDGSQVADAEIEGSIAMVNGRFAAGRSTGDAFAIVHVGASGIPVQSSHRDIGTTDLTGNILVPNLVPNVTNRIGLNVEKMPLDVVAVSSQEAVVPLAQAGLLVDLAAIPADDGANVTFVDEAGGVIPAGTNGLIGTKAFVVGYDGQAYITGLGAQNTVTLALPGGRSCEANFTYTPDAEGMRGTVGPVTCAGGGASPGQGLPAPATDRKKKPRSGTGTPVAALDASPFQLALRETIQ